MPSLSSCQDAAPSPHYVYEGDGEAGRLSAQGALIHAQTMDLLQRAGLKKGMSVLDMGCGGGDMSFSLAEAVGPAGKVMGIDFNPQMIAMNKERNHRQAQVHFEVGNAEEYTTMERYDLAYSRFMMAHLRQPERAIRNMLAALKPGGVIVVEDVDVGAMDASPKHPAIEEHKELLIAFVKHNGGDACIGPRLAGLMRQAGVEELHASSHQPSGKEGPIKDVPRATLEGLRARLVQSGFAAAEAITRLSKELATLAADTSVTLLFPKMYQVYGKIM